MKAAKRSMIKGKEFIGRSSAGRGLYSETSEHEIGKERRHHEADVSWGIGNFSLEILRRLLVFNDTLGHAY